MALSEAYLEWEQQAEARATERGTKRGMRSLILRQLTRKVGELPDNVRSQIEALSIEQLESLGEALLSFSALADLEQWLTERQA